MILRLRQMIYALSSIGAVSTLGFIAYAGQSFRSLFSGFTPWALASYVVFAVAGLVAYQQWLAAIVLVSSLVATLFAAAGYFDALFIHVHSTSALVFIFVPLYQLILAALVLLISLVSRFLRVRPTI